MNRKIDWVILLLVTVWYSGIFIYILIKIFPPLIFAFPIVNHLYSLVCHQNPAKLIPIYTGHTLICARCAGIYSGIFFISLISLFIKRNNIKSRKLFYTALIIILFEVLMTTFKIYEYSKIVAFTTGIFFGGVMFLYFRSALQKLFKTTETN